MALRSSKRIPCLMITLSNDSGDKSVGQGTFSVENRDLEPLALRRSVRNQPSEHWHLLLGYNQDHINTGELWPDIQNQARKTSSFTNSFLSRAIFNKRPTAHAEQHKYYIP